MEKEIREKLLNINTGFYSAFAKSFSTTRAKVQPGIQQLIENVPENANLLDLGCGNGTFLHYLAEQGFCGSYTGLDFSLKLLKDAQELNRSIQSIKVDFDTADLSAMNWDAGLVKESFDIVTAFAVLHHLPDTNMRKELLIKIHKLLKPNGAFWFSVWQFTNSPRLRKHVLPWESLQISPGDVEAGDTLLDWRAEADSGQIGLRYVHLFNESELSTLAHETGFTIESHFYSDGREGNLALYQVWVKEG